MHHSRSAFLALLVATALVSATTAPAAACSPAPPTYVRPLAASDDAGLLVYVRCNNTLYPEVACFDGEAPPLTITGPGDLRVSGTRALVEELGEHAALVRFRPDAPFESGLTYRVAYDDSGLHGAATFTYGAVPATRTPFAAIHTVELASPSAAGTVYTCRSRFPCGEERYEFSSELLRRPELYASLGDVPGQLVAMTPGRDAEDTGLTWELSTDAKVELSLDEERCITAFARDVLSGTVTREVVCMTASTAPVIEPSPPIELSLCDTAPVRADTGEIADELLAPWCATQQCAGGSCGETNPALRDTCAAAPAVDPGADDEAPPQAADSAGGGASEGSAAALGEGGDDGCRLSRGAGPGGLLPTLLALLGLALWRRAPVQRRNAHSGRRV